MMTDPTARALIERMAEELDHYRIDKEGHDRSHPLAKEARALLAAEQQGEGPTIGDIMQLWASTPYIDEAEGAIAFARAVLARWGRPAAPPAKGEVAGLVGEALIAVSGGLCYMTAEAKHAQLKDVEKLLTRTAALLQQQHPQPVPVSERLPGAEDCDAEGRCWLCGNVESDWRLMNPEKTGVPQLKYCFSHWLPAHALPLPVPVLEVS